MAAHITTNLRLPKGEYEELTYRARRRGVSIASLVREAVAEYLGGGSRARAADEEPDPFEALIGSIKSGHTDESINHDHYLYGWPKETEEDETARGHGRPARPSP